MSDRDDKNRSGGRRADSDNKFSAKRAESRNATRPDTQRSDDRKTSDRKTSDRKPTDRKSGGRRDDARGSEVRKVVERKPSRSARISNQNKASDYKAVDYKTEDTKSEEEITEEKNAAEISNNRPNELVKYKNEFFASCPTGLEELLLTELKEMGIKDLVVARGGVNFNCFPQIALKAILYSRMASRIYKKLYGFEIKKEKDIYYEAKKIKWKGIFNLEQTFKINALQGNSPNGKKASRFPNSMFLSQQLKDAIADRFRKDCDGERPNVDKRYAEASFLLRITPNDNDYSTKEQCIVLLDLSGESLSHRGYRQARFAAPLRENLAAAIIKMSGYDGSQTFIDGMTGSGTFLAEAALIKANIPPTYLKVMAFKEESKQLPWAFLHLNLYTKDQYLIEEFEKVLDACYNDCVKGFEKLEADKTLLRGFDLSKNALEIAAENLESAKLLDYVLLDRVDFTETVKPADSKGIIVFNPPYGERLGSEDDLEKLYHDVGENLKTNYKGYAAYVFTGNLPLLKKISLQTSKRTILFNGNIESRLAEYLLY